MRSYNIHWNKIEDILRSINREHSNWAHAGRDTGGSQFFVVLDEGNTKHLNRKHTIFGPTIEGLDVVQQIQAGDKMIKVEVLELDPAIEAHELQKLKSWR